MTFHVFAFLWYLIISIACFDFIVTSICVIWYFNQNNPNSKPIKEGIVRCFRYHLGTVVFGSLLIGFFGWIRSFLELFLVVDKDKNKNWFTKIMFYSCCCCIMISEVFFLFVDKAIYI